MCRCDDALVTLGGELATLEFEIMLGHLIELIARIWEADSDIRDRSRFGESELDKQSRRTVAWICGGATALILIAWALWVWFGDEP